eukprot:10470348-Alexandrium_andersonii.AAC.1
MDSGRSARSSPRVRRTLRSTHCPRNCRHMPGVLINNVSEQSHAQPTVANSLHNRLAVCEHDTP